MTPITDRLREQILVAAERADWMTVVLNQGPPCFHLEDSGKFCLRAQRWAGHTDKDEWPEHRFVSLAALVAALTPTTAQEEKDDLSRQSSPCPPSGTGSPRSPQPNGSEQSRNRFAAIRKLRKDWDSYGADPIDGAVIDRAEKFLDSVNVVPCSGGGVQLEWHGREYDIEIQFHPDGTVEIYTDELGRAVQRLERSLTPNPAPERRPRHGQDEATREMRAIVALREQIEREIETQESYARGDHPVAEVWKNNPGPVAHAHTADVLRQILTTHHFGITVALLNAEARTPIRKVPNK